MTLDRQVAAREVARRLPELSWILRQIETAIGMHAESWAQLDNLYGEGVEIPGDHPLAVNMTDAQMTLRVLTEGFYWSAARVRNLVRSLPGLRAFDDVGARNVRNKVLEHQEAFDSTWDPFMAHMASELSWHPDSLTTLRRLPEDRKGSMTEDAGLRANAQEFRDSLDRLLERTLG